MSLASLALPQLEKRLPKIISPTVHGLIDYGHAAFFLCAALALRKSNPRAALAAAGTGAFVLIQSLLTDYPLGLKPIISFHEHGEMDAAMAGASVVIPRILNFSETKAAALFRGNGVVESAIVAMTDFDSDRARNEKARSRT